MVWIEVLAIVPISEHHVIVDKFMDGKVGCVAAVAMDEDIECFRLGLYKFDEIADLYPFPEVIET